MNEESKQEEMFQITFDIPAKAKFIYASKMSYAWAKQATPVEKLLSWFIRHSDKNGHYLYQHGVKAGCKEQLKITENQFRHALKKLVDSGALKKCPTHHDPERCKVFCYYQLHPTILKIANLFKNLPQ